jgi:hypothetical protein
MNMKPVDVVVDLSLPPRNRHAGRAALPNSSFANINIMTTP